jgi:hypothetical protein
MSRLLHSRKGTETLLLLLVSGFVGAPKVFADTPELSLTDVIGRSATIAVATLGEIPQFGATRTTLNILEVLKGPLNRGQLEARVRYFRPRLTGQFVAFIDNDGYWQFTAVPLKGTQVGDAVLSITGVSKASLHIVTVSPGLVTLRQLKEFLRVGALTYKFGGNVYFPAPGKTAWERSCLTLTGSYNAVTNELDVQGPSGLKCFPKPQVDIHANLDANGAGITLEYGRGLLRPLQFAGWVSDFDRVTQTMELRFSVIAPDLLSKKIFEDYLADDRRGPPDYVFRLCAPSVSNSDQRFAKVLLTLGQEAGEMGHVEDDAKMRHPIVGMSRNGPKLRSGSTIVPPDNLPKSLLSELAAEDLVLRVVVPVENGEYLILAYDTQQSPGIKGPFRWVFQNNLLYGLWAGSGRGTLELHDNKARRLAARCVTTLEAVKFRTLSGGL